MECESLDLNALVFVSVVFLWKLAVYIANESNKSGESASVVYVGTSAFLDAREDTGRRNGRLVDKWQMWLEVNAIACLI